MNPTCPIHHHALGVSVHCVMLASCTIEPGPRTPSMLLAPLMASCAKAMAHPDTKLSVAPRLAPQLRAAWAPACHSRPIGRALARH
eukprot:scaffold37929_cov37-Tisochrysis_lutea.AAC.2